MKTSLFVLLSLFTLNAMAITSVECLQGQVSAFEKAKLESAFTEVKISLRDSSRSSEYAPLIKVEGNKITIEPIFDNGICVVATSEFIQEEVSRLSH